MNQADWRELVLYFSSWNWWVLPTLALIAYSLATKGTFMLYARQTLLGDAMAHAALPGVCLAYTLLGSSSLEWLMLGGTLGGVAAIGLYFIFVRFFALQIDSALGLVLSLGFSIGIMWLGHLARVAPGVDLEHMLWGEAGGAELPHFYLWAALAGITTLFLARYGKFRRLSVFDPDFLRASGISIWVIELGFYVWYSLIVSAALFSVGLMLVMAFVSLPGLCLSLVPHKASKGAWLAGVLAASATLIPSVSTYFLEAVLPGPSTVILLFGCYAGLRALKHFKRQGVWQ